MSSLAQIKTERTFKEISEDMNSPGVNTTLKVSGWEGLWVSCGIEPVLMTGAAVAVRTDMSVGSGWWVSKGYR